jgi:hypothetical protein
MTPIRESLFYLKKIYSHLHDIVKYEFLKQFGKLNFFLLCDLCFMRWIIPTGLVRGNTHYDSSFRSLKLSSDGYIILEQVPEPIITEIHRAVIQQLNKYGALGSADLYSSQMIFRGQQREIVMVSKGESSCPLAKLSRSQAYVDLACNYLGLHKEKLVINAYVDILNPFMQPGNQYDALSFHRDIDSYRFLKIFVYLKECKEGQGHHEYVTNTHNRFPSALIEFRSYSQEEIIAAIPSAHTVKMVGQSGFTFAENTIGFHRGTLPNKEYRVMATIVYMQDRFKAIYPDYFFVKA